MGTTGMACQKPLSTDVLHYRIPTAFGSLLHLLDKGGGLRVFLLHGNQIGRTQLATRQIGPDLVVIAVDGLDQSLQLLGWNSLEGFQAVEEDGVAIAFGCHA